MIKESKDKSRLNDKILKRALNQLDKFPKWKKEVYNNSFKSINSSILK